MTPIVFLSILLIATAAVTIVQMVRRRIEISRLRQLASRWQMHYTPDDRFRLSTRVAPRLGVPGAACVRVQDVIYGSEGDCYRYFFTAQFTIGVLKRKSDEQSVCTITEQKAREGNHELGPITVASGGVTVVDQYEYLKKGLRGIAAG
ncbi:MAG TPA: hypothetical protein VF669_09620 [Tepidisphaeraceae bacterium]|jgi:hypothetical protein